MHSSIQAKVRFRSQITHFSKPYIIAEISEERERERELVKLMNNLGISVKTTSRGSEKTSVRRVGPHALCTHGERQRPHPLFARKTARIGKVICGEYPIVGYVWPTSYTLIKGPRVWSWWIDGRMIGVYFWSPVSFRSGGHLLPIWSEVHARMT